MISLKCLKDTAVKIGTMHLGKFITAYGAYDYLRCTDNGS